MSKNEAAMSHLIEKLRQEALALNKTIAEINDAGAETVRVRLWGQYNDFTGYSALKIEITTGRITIGEEL